MKFPPPLPWWFDAPGHCRPWEGHAEGGLGGYGDEASKKRMVVTGSRGFNLLVVFYLCVCLECFFDVDVHYDVGRI